MALRLFMHGAVLLAGVLTAPVAAQDLKPWKHGVIEPKGDGGFMLMVGQRDFAKKHGLKLQIIKLKNGALAHKALLAGRGRQHRIEPGRGDPGRLARRRHQDRRLRLAGRAARADGATGINKVADLKGKTVAVASPGSLPNLLIKAMLEKYKVPRREVHFANLGGDLDRYKAVVAGVADAGIVAAEFMAVAPKDITCWCTATRCCRTMCGCACP